MNATTDGVDPAEYGERIAHVYDEWHGADRGEGTEVVDLLVARAGGGPALELGIGTGRIALPLAARGVPVVGIDASERMVARLRAKPGGQDLPVTIGDFADVDAPGGPFRLIYVVFNTFFALLTQADQTRCFTHVAERLGPGGVFVLEAFVPDPTLYDRGQRLLVTGIAGGQTRLSASMVDRATQRVRSRHIAIADDAVEVYPVELRYAWPSELDLMAQLAGLTLTDRYGGWNGEPFTAASNVHVSIWSKSSSRA